MCWIYASIQYISGLSRYFICNTYVSFLPVSWGSDAIFFWLTYWVSKARCSTIWAFSFAATVYSRVPTVLSMLPLLAFSACTAIAKGWCYIMAGQNQFIDYVHMTRDHSIPQNAETWSKSWNLPISVEFLCFCGMLRNSIPVPTTDWWQGKTRKLSYRKDDQWPRDAPYIWVPWKFLRVPE